MEVKRLFWIIPCIVYCYGTEAEIVSTNFVLYADKSDALNITCKINTSDSFNVIYFLKNGKLIKDSLLVSGGAICYPEQHFICDHTKKMFTYTLMAGSFADGDTWSCRAGATGANSKSVTIIILGNEAEILSTNSILYVKNGDTLNITCKINGTGRFNLIYFVKNGTDIASSLLVNGGAMCYPEQLFICDHSKNLFTYTLESGGFTNGDTWNCRADTSKITPKHVTIIVVEPFSSITMTLPFGNIFTMNVNLIGVFECVTSLSRPEAEILWYTRLINGTEIQLFSENNTEVMQNGSMSWTRSNINYTAKASDNGTKMLCKGFLANLHEELPKESKEIELNIKYPPAEEPQTNNNGFVTVEEGYTIEIQCYISGGNPIALLHWKCDNRHVSGTNTINATIFLSELSLLAKPAYNGKSCYCYASHPLFAEKKVQTVLTILYAPFQLPVITQSYPQTDVISEDTIVTLSCDVSDGNPLAVLYWDCDTNIAVTNNTSSNKSSYSVTIRVSKQDNGRICTCSATHPVRSYHPSVQHKIKVYYVPYIHMEPKYNPFIIYTKQKNIVLTCVIDDANPVESVTYEWNSPSGTMNTHNITMSTVNKSQDGQYSCTVSNVAGTSKRSTKQIDVQYGPLISNIVNTQNIIEGNNLIVSPIVDANPAANFFWWTRENNSYFRYNGSVLRINKIHKTSSGNYSFYVVNTITPSGMDPFNVTTQKTFYVDVQFKPFLEQTRPYSPSHVTALANTTIQLTLTINANPTPTIEWTFRGEADWNSCNFITLVSNTTTIGFLTKSSILIENVHNSSFGDYAVTANNTAGIFFRRFVVRDEGQEMFASTKENTGILVAGISTLIVGLLSLTAAVMFFVRNGLKNKALQSSKSGEYTDVQKNNPAFTDLYSTLQSDIESRSPNEQIINTYEECGKPFEEQTDSSFDKMESEPRKPQQYGVNTYEECGKIIEAHDCDTLHK